MKRNWTEEDLLLDEAYPMMKHATIINISDGKTIICEVLNVDDYLTDEEHQANANLIMAAPDLLEALELLIADMKLRASLSENPHVLDVSCGIYLKAEKAIAKAKGVKYE